jgi:predicted  nucleic acid-binding Zn-ribbon protein
MLELQAMDTALAQLRHRRANLPEQAELGAAQAALAATQRELDAATDTAGSAAVELASIESMTTDLDATYERLERQLRTVTSTREADAIQHELETLALRRGEADERGLELLMLLDELAEQRVELDARLHHQTVARDDAAGTLRAIEEEIDAEMQAIEARRTHAADALDPAQLERYERLRQHGGGVGIARLVGSRCEGCHLDLSRTELEAVRAAPEGEAECPSCGRLLVV